MPKLVFQPSEYKEAIKQALREGKKPEDLTGEFPVSIRSMYRYLKEVEKEKNKPPPKIAALGSESAQKPPAGASASGNVKQVTPKTPSELVSIQTRIPAPILFRMGDITIDLNPQHLYDAYRYCEDIRRIDPSIDDDFSLMLKISAKHMWEIFSKREARRAGVHLTVEREEVTVA